MKNIVLIRFQKTLFLLFSTLIAVDLCSTQTLFTLFSIFKIYSTEKKAFKTYFSVRVTGRRSIFVGAVAPGHRDTAS